MKQTNKQLRLVLIKELQVLALKLELEFIQNEGYFSDSSMIALTNIMRDIDRIHHTT